MSTSENQDVQPAEAADRGLTWRKLAVRAAFAIPIVFLLLMLISMEFVPFLLIFIVVFAALGFWASRGGKASAIVLGVLSVIFIGTNLPFLMETLSIPASPIDFISNSWILLSAITAAVAGFFAFRGAGADGGATTFARVVMGVAAVVVVVSVFSFVTYEDDTKQDGDIEMTTADFEFQPDEIDADGGTVGVFITNEDPASHTFTIEELDVDVVIPQGAKVRVEFEADGGEYEFICVPHEGNGMTGTLQVQ
jgi:plastocyanin